MAQFLQKINEDQTIVVQKEAFLPNNLSDAELLVMPDDTLTPLTLFVCTYVATLENMHISVEEFTKILCNNLRGCLIAINSNYGHAAQEGYESFIKIPSDKKYIRDAPIKIRKKQGDGTCFNSAVEPIIKIVHDGIPESKTYKVKCFPTTGETQIPGVICPDLSDGSHVIQEFVTFINSIDQFLETDKQVKIISEQPKMLNYKFRVIRSTPRMIMKSSLLFNYFKWLDRNKYNIDSKNIDNLPPDLANVKIVLPVKKIRELKMNSIKISFKFEYENRNPRINIFQSGKINILGADTAESATHIYRFFQELFMNNWSLFICMTPRDPTDK